MIPCQEYFGFNGLLWEGGKPSRHSQMAGEDAEWGMGWGEGGLPSLEDRIQHGGGDTRWSQLHLLGEETERRNHSEPLSHQHMVGGVTPCNQADVQCQQTFAKGTHPPLHPAHGGTP